MLFSGAPFLSLIRRFLVEVENAMDGVGEYDEKKSKPM
jgi:hypothetical protein